MLAPNTNECPLCRLLSLALSDTNRRLYRIVSTEDDDHIIDLLESEGFSMTGFFDEIEYKLFHARPDEDGYEMEFYLLTNEQAIETGLTPLTNDNHELELLLEKQNRNNKYVPITIPIDQSLTMLPKRLCLSGGESGAFFTSTSSKTILSRRT